MFNKDELKEMFNFTINKKETIIVGILIAIQIGLYEISYPIILKKVMDEAIPEENIKLIISLSLILFFIVIIKFFFDRYTEIRRKKCCINNDMQIKKKIFSKLQDAKIQEIEKYKIGELFETTTNQSFEAARLFIWNFIGFISVRVIAILIIGIIMYIINYKIAVIIVTIFILAYIPLIPIYSKTQKIYKQLQNILLELQSIINEYIDSYLTTKTLILEKSQMENMEKYLKESKEEIKKANKVIERHNALFSLLSFASIIALVIIGGNELTIGITTSATIMLILNYIDDLNKHMQILLGHIHEGNNRYNCFLNVLEIMKAKKETDSGMKRLNNIQEIEFREVSLSYDGINTVLEKINLKIDKPIKIAIVGKSGSGKTSLVNLIPRFYEISKGNIYINNEDYRKYKLSELRKNISYVFQEPVIFNMSIEDNIKFGNDNNITRKQIEDICKKIGLSDKIEKLPSKYECIINEQTDLLSYGEKQLISFARAILKNTSLIILDEVTSNLDLEFEENVLKATKEILDNKIAFIIAHRLNTIKNSDLIIFIEDKHIVEIGKHDELIEKQGYYYNLYKNRIINQK